MKRVKCKAVRSISRPFLNIFLAILAVLMGSATRCSTQDQVIQAVEDAYVSVGATPGEFSASGAAYYKIPIEVPPGTNGMKPDLSIVYNSDGGNGLLGMGFSLAGLSSITRTGASEFYDGYNRGVTNTYDDRFALEGERLILVGTTETAAGGPTNPGVIAPDAYGMDGLIYYTSRNSWRKVISHDTSGLGPRSFTVYHPDGTRYDYGTTASLKNSRQTVRIWPLTRVTDLNTNSMTFSYFRDDGSGDLRIKQIDYTGNETTGMTPQRSVRFVYEETVRADATVRYQAGAPYTVATRLSKIQTVVRNRPVKTYVLSYAYSPITGRSLLKRIQEFAGDDRDNIALPPTTFDYPEELAPVWRASAEFMPPRNTWLNHTALNDSNDWYTIDDGAQLIDLDGDGILDWLHANESGQTLNMGTWLNQTGQRQTASPVWKKFAQNLPWPLSATFADDGAAYTIDYGVRLSDLDGDGRLDILSGRVWTDHQAQPGAWYQAISGFQNVAEYQTPSFWLTSIEKDPSTDTYYTLDNGFRLVDLNGDGLQDLIQAHYNQKTGATTARTYLNSGRSRHEVGSGWLEQPKAFQAPFYLTYSHTRDDLERNLDIGAELADITGDGLPDLVVSTNFNGAPLNFSYLNASTAWQLVGGNQLPPDIWLKHLLTDDQGNPYTINDGARFVDLNGDGLLDVIRAHLKGDPATNTNENTVRVYLNTGKMDNRWAASAGFAQKGIFLTASVARDNREYDVRSGYQLVDLNGDGLPDLVTGIKTVSETVNGVWLNTGAGWADAPDYHFPDETWLTELVKPTDDAIPHSIRNGAQLVDLNGDGLPDLLHAVRSLETRADGVNKAWLNTGSGWKEAGAYKLPYNQYLTYSYKNRKTITFAANTRLADLNGDGLVDLVASNKCDNPAADRNNDGRADLLPAYQVDDIASVTLPGAWLNPGPAFQDRLVTIRDGRGKTISIEYAPLTDSEVYARFDDHKDRVWNVQNSAPVVKNYRITDGNNTPFQHYRYRYEGLKVSRDHGSMGFRTVTRIDELLGRQWVTTRIQDRRYPETIGLIDRVDGPRQRTRYNYHFQESEPLPGMLPRLSAMEETVTRFADDEKSRMAYSRSKVTTFDEYGNITLVSEGGNDTRSRFTHFVYDIDEPRWLLRLPAQKKITTNPQYEPRWNHDTDLSWERFEYDHLTANLTASRHWDSQPWDGLQWDSRWGRWSPATTYDYDAYGNPTRITTGVGQPTVITYDPDFHTFETSRTFPPVNGVTLVEKTEHDPHFGVLLGDTAANGSYVGFAIDGFGRVTEKWGPHPLSGEKVRLEAYKSFPKDGYIEELTWRRHDWDAPASGEAWYVHMERIDAVDRTVYEESTASGGRVAQRRDYNEKGLLTRESMPYDPALDMPGITYTRFTYDARGNMATMIGEGRITRFTVSEDGRSRIQEIHDLMTGVLLDRTVSELDMKGQVINRTDMDGAVTTYQYDLLDRPTFIRDPGGVNHTTAYRSGGQKARIDNGDIGVKSYFYFPNGLLHREYDANNNQIEYQYDALDRLTFKTVSKPTAPYTGRVVEYSIRYEYDRGGNGRGLLHKVTVEKDGQAVSSEGYDYDRTGALSQKVIGISSTGTSEPDTYVYRYQYDPQDRLIRQTFPDGHFQRNEYDADGRLKIIKALAPDGTTIVGSVAFDEYTALGQPTRMSFGNGLTAVYNHDGYRGLLQSHQLGKFDPTNGSLIESALIDKSYRWSANFQLTAIADRREDKTPQDDESQTFTYNDIGRLTQAVGAYGTVHYAHDIAGNLTQKGGLEFSYQADPGTQRSHRAASDQLTLRYDPAGNLISKTTDSDHWQYAYDGENRLITVERQDLTRPNGGVATVSSYQYDHSGRLLRETRWSGGDQTGRKTSLAADYVIIENGATAVDRRFIDGPTGHLIAFTVLHDPRNYIEQVSHAGRVGDSGVLPRLRELRRGLEPVLAYVQTAPFLADVSRGMVLLSLLVGFWGMTGMGVAKPAVPGQKRWASAVAPPLLAALLITTLLGGTTPLAAQDSPAEQVQVRYYHHDYINSVDVLTDQNGAVAHRVLFKPYGEVYDPSSRGDYRDEFTGQEWDPSSRLYYFQARFYDPQLGRFLTPDSEVGNSPFAPSAFNRYAYAGGNPILYNDPSGHFIVSLLIGAVLGAVLGAAIDAISQGVEGGDFDLGQWGTNIGIGAAAGAVFAVFSVGFGAAGAKLGSKLASSASKSGWKKVINIAVGAVAEGLAGFAAQSAVNFIEMGITGKEFDWAAAGIASAIGVGLGGLVGGALSQYVGKAARRVTHTRRTANRPTRHLARSGAHRRQPGKTTRGRHALPRTTGQNGVASNPLPKRPIISKVGNPFSKFNWRPHSWKDFGKDLSLELPIAVPHDMLAADVIFMAKISGAFDTD